MKGIILFGILFIVLGFILNYFLKEKFNIDRKRNEMSVSVKRFQSIVANSFVVTFIVLAIILVSKYEELSLFVIFIPYFLVLTTFRTIMEWVYNRNANYWISEMLSLVLISTYFILVYTLGYL